MAGVTKVKNKQAFARWIVGKSIPGRGSSCAKLGSEKGLHVQGREQALKAGKGGPGATS